MNTPHARQLAPTEAELRQVTYQVQARMDAELARANDIIGELQKANAELRQTLAAERQQLAELRKRLMSGRSIALQ
jgi:predicted  nucleic acid-binding Zn-ribbon protein